MSTFIKLRSQIRIEKGPTFEALKCVLVVNFSFTTSQLHMQYFIRDYIFSFTYQNSELNNF